MYSPTKWQWLKDMFRCLVCRHKHTEIRTVEGGSEDDQMQVIGRFKYCLDCENNLGWL
jgi:transcription elongation factor Elf1